MSDSELEVYNSDHEISKTHEKLLEAVSQLDTGPRIPKHQRSELSLVDSKYYLSKCTNINDCQNNEKKVVSKNLTEDEVLPRPLEKSVEEKIKRIVGFKNTQKQLGEWTGIVAKNRTAACISFPLSQSSVKLQPTDQYVKRFRLQSELEKKLADLESQNEQEKKEDKFPLTLVEVMQRQKEAARFRAQQSYKAAKACRQNKIKSKKFHRIQRKEKIKQALKEFEELQKTDPQAALEKLEQFDKVRAEERMTLRHKNTGQWAKNQQIRAKYDKESRQILANQLQISKELTQKLKNNGDSDEEESENQTVLLPVCDQENPWMYPVKTESEIDQFISGYRKYWDEQKKIDKDKNESSKSNCNNTIAVKNNSILTIQNSPEQHLPEHNSTSELCNTKMENSKRFMNNKNQQIKLQNCLKDKLGIKLSKSKIIKVKAGTSNWSISTMTPMIRCNSKGNDSNSEEFNSNNNKMIKKKKRKNDSLILCMENETNERENINIDDKFDSLEKDIQLKINKKIKKLNSLLNEKTNKKNKKEKRKKKRDESVDNLEKLAFKAQKDVRPIIDKPIEESIDFEVSNNPAFEEKTNVEEYKQSVIPQSHKTEIDPNNFINMKPKYIHTLVPDEVHEENDAIDDSEIEDQHQIISEAFADDDMVDEFQKDKEEEIKKAQPEDVSILLPGWGSWSGKNLKPSSRKRRRFIIKIPKEAPRRDENKGDVVIIEEKCPKIKKHLVSELPFPFTSVQDFEASIRAPIGRDFVPEKAFNKLVTPAIKTKMGKVIAPMSDDVLVKTDKLGKKKNKSTKDNSKNKKNLQLQQHVLGKK